MRTLSLNQLLISACSLTICAHMPKCLGQHDHPPSITAQIQTAERNPATPTLANPIPTSPTTDQIVALMVARNQSRAEELRGYTGRRIYHLQYHGFPGSRDAELMVEARFDAPATKQFRVISQSGSKLLVEKVLKGLLQSEQEAQSAQNRQQTALTPQNYSFELAGQQTTDQGRFYILKVQPKIANKFLYRGEIWVDANDFAIACIEAEPAENPSFWINHTKVEQRYAKFGSFWLPVRNQSTSKVRLGGTATLVIEYQDYRLSSNPQGKIQASVAEPVSAF